jgi:hypothetical protein
MTGILPSDIGSPDCAIRIACIMASDALAGTELGAILKERATAQAAETIASERKRREEVLSAAVEHAIEADYLREIAKSWPDAKTMDRYSGEYKQFVSWCRDRGLGWLPAASTTVCGYMLDRTLSDDIGIDAALQIVDAISFAHDTTSNYLERTPINATIQFLRRVGDEMAGLAVEASNSLVEPKLNGNGAAHD